MTIPQHILDDIRQHASYAAPNECCGLLAGHGSTVDLRIELVNELSSPIAYSASPASLFRAFKQIRIDEKELIGFYHSHPLSEAVPSRRDRDEWHYPDCAMVIVSLTDNTIRAWRQIAEEFREIELSDDTER